MTPSIRVKICGITCREDALAAIDAGADALGFNLFPGSKRYVVIEDLLPWLTSLGGILRVAVMVNPSIEQIRLARPFFDVIQLHGQETPALCGEAASTGATWKAFPIAHEIDTAATAALYPASALMIDSAVPGAFGGTGVLIDLERAALFVRASPGRPVWLSGGLNPGNVAEAVEKVRPYGVDVASGVEVGGDFRRKDAGKIGHSLPRRGDKLEIPLSGFDFFPRRSASCCSTFARPYGPIMRKKLSLILCSASILTAAAAVAQQPGTSPVPSVTTSADASPAPMPASGNAPAAEAPAPIEPPVTGPGGPGLAPTPTGAAADQAAESGTAGGAAGVSGTGAALDAGTLGGGPGHALNEFQGDDVAQVLRLLARQSKISLVVSDRISDAQPPMKVTMRLEDKTPMEAIKIIVFAKGLNLLQKDGVYYVQTKEEKEAEPTEPAAYTFSYGTAEKVLPLLAAQLESKVPPQFDPRTNTVFYREVGSNMDAIKLFLQTIDQPTKQVMIEARLVEVTANPAQSYGFNWGGVFGSQSTPQTFTYGGATPGTSTYNLQTNPTTGAVNPILVPSTPPTVNVTNGAFAPSNFLLNAQTGVGGLLRAYGGQFAILSVPQMSVTMRFLNEDADAEFLANPRIVTANNQQATIEITRNQPVPNLNFNSQTATAVFGGFEDKNYGNTLTVTPSINKDDFVTLNVKPKISNKVADAVFTFSGATVSSPIIDTRSLESTVLIKSGDTLAIGGLLQDELTKTTNKVPVLGDLPGIGYAFQEHLNVRTKRNLLVFVTPTIIQQGYGTGLEDQVNGLHHSGEEYADPNGWRNNAKGALRWVPTSHRSIAADYPKPGVPQEPARDPVNYRDSAAPATGN